MPDISGKLPPIRTGEGLEAAEDAASTVTPGTPGPARTPGPASAAGIAGRTTSGDRLGAGKSTASSILAKLNNIRSAEPANLGRILTGKSLGVEIDAIEELAKSAIPKGVKLRNLPDGKDAAWFYNYQMGRIDADGNEIKNADEAEIIRMVKMYDMLPSELLERSKLAPNIRDPKDDTREIDNPQFINAAWLNQAFIDAYNQIEATDPLVTTIIHLENRGLITLPRNIIRLTVAGLYLSDNHLAAVPLELEQLTALKRVTLYNNHLTQVQIDDIWELLPRSCYLHADLVEISLSIN